jgi:hypothetical protein
MIRASGMPINSDGKQNLTGISIAALIATVQ